MRRADFNGVRALCAPVPTLRKLIAVMSKKVPKHSHRWSVGVTAKDAQPAECSSASGLVASEDPISGKEEVHAKRCGKECGTKIPGFHHCNRQEPEAAIDIERESGWEQRSQNVFRHCIRKHQRCSQLGFDRHSMSSEQVQQSSEPSAEYAQYRGTINRYEVSSLSCSARCVVPTRNCDSRSCTLGMPNGEPTDRSRTHS